MNTSINKKLLLISFSFYPDDSPNTYRWKSIIDIWTKKGIEVFVVSAQKPGFSKYEYTNGIKIYRTGQSLFQKLKTRIGNRSNNNISVSKKNNAIRKEGLLRKIYNNTWRQLFWPDWAFLSYFPTVRIARTIIKKEGIRHMITVSWPFTDHLIGYKLKNEFDLLWLTEIIDPFSFNDAINNQKIYSKLNLRMEDKILNKADLITVMTNLIKDKYLSLFPSINDKIKVIHNIFAPPNQIYKPVLKDQNHTIKFIFIGTLSAEVRSPKHLLSIFKSLLNMSSTKSLELHFYGKISSNIDSFNDYTELVNKSIFIHGPVQKVRVNEILHEADVLVNIGNSNPYQEPSKIIEYIYLGKPVINICSIDNDSSRELLDKYPLNFNYHASEIDNTLIINRLFEFVTSQHNVERTIIDKILSQYLLNEIERAYYSLFWKS